MGYRKKKYAPGELDCPVEGCNFTAKSPAGLRGHLQFAHDIWTNRNKSDDSKVADNASFLLTGDTKPLSKEKDTLVTKSILEQRLMQLRADIVDDVDQALLFLFDGEQLVDIINSHDSRIGKVSDQVNKLVSEVSTYNNLKIQLSDIRVKLGVLERNIDSLDKKLRKSRFEVTECAVCGKDIYQGTKNRWYHCDQARDKNHKAKPSSEYLKSTIVDIL